LSYYVTGKNRVVAVTVTPKERGGGQTQNLILRKIRKSSLNSKSFFCEIYDKLNDLYFLNL
jgi:hypothetical protein